jgi:thioredoxin 1
MLRLSFALVFILLIHLVPLPANAGTQTIDFTPGVIAAALERGETVFVDYSASWCSVCARQGRAIDKIRSGDPKFNEAITFVKVDWNTYQSKDVVKSRNIPRRSTLILLRGDMELGRLIAQIDEAQIKRLMEKAF